MAIVREFSELWRAQSLADMQALGRGDEFQSRREYLVNEEGWGRNEAWKQAAGEMRALGPVASPGVVGKPPGSGKDAPSAAAPGWKDQKKLKDAPVKFGYTKRSFAKIEKEASAREVIEWVANTWKIDDMRPSEAPSSGAWFLRENMRSDEAFAREFYRNIYTKLLPTKQQMQELQDRSRDDSRKDQDLIDDAIAVIGALQDQDGHGAGAAFQPALVGG